MLLEALNIINTGTKAWQILNSSSSSISVSGCSANAIPGNVSIEKLVGWKSSEITLHYNCMNPTNKFAVADVDIYLYWQYGGSIDGRGKFIINANGRAKINKLTMLHKLNIQIEFQQPYNHGTQDSPIAALPFIITLTHSYLLQRDTILQWRGTIYGAEGEGGGAAYNWKSEYLS